MLSLFKRRVRFVFYFRTGNIYGLAYGKQLSVVDT